MQVQGLGMAQYWRSTEGVWSWAQLWPVVECGGTQVPMRMATAQGHGCCWESRCYVPRAGLAELVDRH